MKTLLLALSLLLLPIGAIAQNSVDSIKDKTDKAVQVRKEQNAQAAHTENILNREQPLPRGSVSRPDNAPATSATSTNNGSNKASGNAQPSSTPAASNVPPPTAGNNGTDVQNRPTTTNTPVVP